MRPAAKPAICGNAGSGARLYDIGLMWKPAANQLFQRDRRNAIVWRDEGLDVGGREGAPQLGATPSSSLRRISARSWLMNSKKVWE